MLLVHDDDGQLARLRTVLDLTRTLNGHLVCLDGTPTPVYGANSYAGFGLAILLNDERQNEATKQARIKACVAGENISWSGLDAAGDFDECVIDAAILAHLIMLSRALDDPPLPDRLSIVAVPEVVDGFDAKGRALLACYGQETAAMTMRACVPLLQLASDVEIFMARDGAEKIEPDDAVSYLSRYGIQAPVMIVVDGLHHADIRIENAARRWRADYVLMEAFRGVTKRMFSNSTLPLVIGH